MGTVGRLEEHPVEGRRVRVRKTAEGWGRVGKKGVAEQGEDWQEKCCEASFPPAATVRR